MVTVLSGLVLSPLHATIGENRLPLFSTHKQPKEQMIPSGAVTVAWPETSFRGRKEQAVVVGDGGGKNENIKQQSLTQKQEHLYETTYNKADGRAGRNWQPGGCRIGAGARHYRNDLFVEH
jgi:hypothetical protein